MLRRFGFLQLDSVSVAGARSHAIVLASRLSGFEPALAETLLAPGAPIFEYWAHEASWIPLELYPVFGFRRRALRRHPWWGDLIRDHPQVARDLLRRAREQGPFRSVDLEGPRSGSWWGLKTAKRVAEALWSSGELAIRERRAFQRVYDLAERVIPADLRARELPEDEAVRTLVLLALQGLGWAESRTIAGAFRLRTTRPSFRAALATLAEEGTVAPCAVVGEDGRSRSGYVRPEDLALAARLERVRPPLEDGVLLSPFDPLLWDRARVRHLFGFDQVLEVYKPAARRTYGYYCLPVLAGERLVARVDLKADRNRGRLLLLSRRHEAPRASPADRAATASALGRYAEGLGLALGTP